VTKGRLGPPTAKYVLHEQFAEDGAHYLRAAEIIRDDLFAMFEYLEPDVRNMGCYSYRIHQLLMRTCIEV